jgi:tagatose 1,6-diphosphate aldolase GatY/KbaY
MIKLQDKLVAVQKAGKAILATNFYNTETLLGIANAVVKTQQPIIFQLTKSSIDYMGLELAVQMARTVIKEYGIEGWIHLDHGDSIDLLQRCLDAGFDSVMIDASEKPLSENIAVTQKAVRIAEKYNANIEAELGYIAKLGQSKEHKFYTEVDEAIEFVNATGVNALAVAIGSAHGFYKESPHLAIDRLREIYIALDIPLVLHGSSGISAEMLCDAMSNGICKINLATEIKNAFMKRVQSELAGSTEIDLRKVFPPAIDAVTKVVADKLEIIGSAKR